KSEARNPKNCCERIDLDLGLRASFGLRASGSPWRNIRPGFGSAGLTWGLCDFAFVSLRAWPAAVVLVKLVSQGPNTDAQQFGCVSAVAFAALECGQDMSLLDFGQCGRLRVGRS